MALSDWDKQNLTQDQQKAIEVYTQRYNQAYKAGDQAGMAAAHAGAERIRAGAGYSGGTTGAEYASKVNYPTVSTVSKGYDNGSLTTAQVKTIQGALGVAQDGYFGPATQKAAVSKWGTTSADAAHRAFTQQQETAQAAWKQANIDYNKAKTYAENYAEQVKPVQGHTGSGRSLEAPATQYARNGADRTGSGRSLAAAELQQLEQEYQNLRSAAMNAIHYGRQTEAKQYEARGRELQDRIAQLRNAGVETGQKLSAGQTVDRVLNAAAYGSASGGVDAARTALEAVGAKQTAQRLAERADRINAQAGAYTSQAKDAKSGVGKVAVDLGINAAQMGMDAVAGIFTGGHNLIPMAIRSFGSGTQEARQNGASLAQQIGYGAGNAAVEVITEKMFDGLAGIYGKGGADEIVEKLIERLAKTEGGRGALRVLTSMGGEALEEVIAGAVEPALRSIYNGKRIGQNYSKDTAEEIAYSALVGGLLGGIGGGVEVARNAALALPTAEERAAQVKAEAQKATQTQQTASNAAKTQQTAANAAQTQQTTANAAPAAILYQNGKETVIPQAEKSAAKPAAQGTSVSVTGQNAAPTEALQSKTAESGSYGEQNAAAENTAQKYEVSALTAETDKQRAQRLTSDAMQITRAKQDSGKAFDLGRLKNIRATDATKYLMPILQKLGITGRSYDNAALDISFEYSNNGARRSIEHQSRDVGQDYRGFAIVQNNLEDLCKNAYPIEAHLDEKPKTEDSHVTQVATLGSVLETAEGYIPVRMSVKFYDNEAPKLHVIINELTPLSDVWTPEAHSTSGSEPATISVADYFRIVNNNEEFLKRVPNALNSFYLGNNSATAQEKTVKPMPTAEDIESGRFTVGEGYTDQVQQAAPEAIVYENGQERVTTAEAVQSAKKENRPTTSKKQLRQEILSAFSIPEGSRATFGAKIDAIAEEVLQKGKITDEHRREIINALYDAGVATIAPQEEFAEVRRMLKGERIYVNESIRADLGDRWNEIRKEALRNGFYLTTDAGKGAGVDVIAAEIADRFGRGIIDPNADGATQLEQMVEAAEQGRGERVSLAEEAEMLEQQYGPGIIEDQISNLERQFDTALSKFAEKAGLETWLKDRTDAKVAQERQAWRDAFAKKDEAKKQREAAALTLRNLKRLRKRIGYNDTRLADAMEKLTPEERTLAEQALNNLSADAQRLTEKTKARMLENAERYEKMLEEDPNYIPDKETLALLERMDQTYLKDMSAEELMGVHRALQRLETHLADMNKEIGEQHREEYSTLYKEVRGEIIGSSRGRKETTPASLFADSQLTPMNYIERLGGWNPGNTWTKTVARQLEEGERARKAFTVEANDMLADFREKNAEWIAKSDGQGKDAIWYDIEVPKLLEYGEGHQPIFGPTVTVHLTPAMRVELARGIRNNDNLRHAEGGVTFPDKELYSKGQRKEAYNRGTTIKLAPETMKKMFSFENLTDEEKKLFVLMDDFFDVKAKNAINETSQIMDGIDRALSNHYSKIYTNANYRSTDATKVDESIGGMGSLQKRTYSKTPMLAMSVWEAFEDTVDTVGKYHGLAIPTRNVNMLLNWSEGDNSLKNDISQEWGGDAVTRLEKLLVNLQNKQYQEKSGFDALADKLLNTYVTATFGANPGIVLKQFSSFPAAAGMLGWENLPTPAQIKNTNEKLIEKYTPELAYRSMGYATPELAELKNNPNWTQKNKVTRYIFGGAIQGMDSFTVKSMWPWAENYVKKNYPDLKAGSDAFYKKTAEVFNDAVTQTQPMYDVMHRAFIMQNPSELTRAVTMFKTVPMQQQNMLRKAAGEARNAQGKAKTEANKNLTKTVLAIAAANLLFEGIEFANQALKNGAKGYRDDDDELSALSVGKEIGEKVVKDTIGMFVGGKTATDALDGILGKTRYYAMEAPGVSQINDVIEAMVKAGKGFRQVAEDVQDLKEHGGSISEYVKTNGGDLLGDMKDLAETVAMYASGAPVANIEKYLLGTLRVISPEVEQEYRALFDTTTKRDLTGMSGGALRARVKDLLENRFESVSDEAVDELARLYESTGVEVIPTDVSSKYSASEEQIYRRAYNAAIGKAMTEMLTSDLFESLSDEQKADAITAMYSYAGDEAKSATTMEERTKAAQTVSELRNMGLEPWKYFAVKGVLGALQENGNVDKLRAIAKMDGLTDEEKRVAMAAVLGTEMTTESGKPSQYAKMTDVLNSGLDLDQYLDVKEADKVDSYLKLIDAGMNSKDSFTVAMKLSDLEPETDKNKVSKMQQYREIAGMDGLSDAGKVTAIGAIMGNKLTTETGNPSQYAKMLWMLNQGVTLNDYINLYEADRVDAYAKYLTAAAGNDYGLSPDAFIAYANGKSAYDADGNGSYTQPEITAAINGIFGDSLTKEQKAVIWQLSTTGKPKNNPFSVSVGTQIYNGKNDGGPLYLEAPDLEAGSGTSRGMAYEEPLYLAAPGLDNRQGRVKNVTGTGKPIVKGEAVAMGPVGQNWHWENGSRTPDTVRQNPEPMTAEQMEDFARSYYFPYYDQNKSGITNGMMPVMDDMFLYGALPLAAP